MFVAVKRRAVVTRVTGLVRRRVRCLRAGEAGQHIQPVEGMILGERRDSVIGPLHVHRARLRTHDADQAHAVAQTAPARPTARARAVRAAASSLRERLAGALRCTLAAASLERGDLAWRLKAPRPLPRLQQLGLVQPRPLKDEPAGAGREAAADHLDLFDPRSGPHAPRTPRACAAARGRVRTCGSRSRRNG